MSIRHSNYARIPRYQVFSQIIEVIHKLVEETN
ncbi:hypothetical protein IFVP18_C150612 [Vibrio parahaemolyticus]